MVGNEKEKLDRTIVENNAYEQRYLYNINKAKP
mgnify:CR=1 FL=1